jgi:hypothetical protein
VTDNNSICTAPVLKSYERTFSVNSVDFTSPRAFSVCIFIFTSTEKAQAHSERTAALVGHFPTDNKSKLVGLNLFVATEDGLGGSGVPVADFEKVVSVAEGR